MTTFLLLLILWCLNKNVCVFAFLLLVIVFMIKEINWE